MIRPILLLSVVLLSSCAHRGPSLPTCSGETRRPANPYGSVLSAPVTTPPAPPTVAEPPQAGGCA